MRGKSSSIHVKLVIDLVMGLLFILCLAFRLTGEKPHEWLGLAVFAVLTAHTWMNRRWYTAMLKGRYTFRRVINTIVNLTLLGLILLLAVGGFMNSRVIAGFIEVSGGMQYRVWHTSAAYWALVLIGVHAGMHWNMIAGVLKKMAGRSALRPAVKIAMRTAVCLILAGGVWASFDREMGSKLFLGFGFDYWPSERPAALFYLSMFSIFSVYAFSAHYFVRLTEKYQVARQPVPPVRSVKI